jgi:hypothetical protein
MKGRFGKSYALKSPATNVVAVPPPTPRRPLNSPNALQNTLSEHVANQSPPEYTYSRLFDKNSNFAAELLASLESSAGQGGVVDHRHGKDTLDHIETIMLDTLRTRFARVCAAFFFLAFFFFVPKKIPRAATYFCCLI